MIFNEILIAISVLLLISNVFFIYKSLKLLTIIENIEDSVQQAMDVLNEKHINFHNLIQKPLFFDNSEIKQVIRDIIDAKDSIHKIALSITEDFSEDTER